ncbi:structural maintenance of chromosomes 5 isoform X2 [Haematobia irritans]|uniref:structural maintenance of chromosomes 5 isoform X2 n=1 Tax=Haematobia irritans TaxID=7368 RepID=UPI003F4FDD4D
MNSQRKQKASKVGKIKSVYCKNFVTYGECIFHPSEYLNVIIGPNGTGKSTLVSAIVLGLGGDPKILARSSSIGDYVKNGYDSSIVTVEVYGHGEETIKYQRTFDKDGKSQFAVNSQTVTHKKFLESVDKFKIQVGNLCQFLPQDRVQDFAKMNPQEILSNTVNSVCGQDVIDNLKKLKELRNSQENGKSLYKTLLQKLESATVRVDELKQQLERYNARKEIQDKLSVCSAKKLRLEINEMQKKLAEYEQDLGLAKENLTTYERDYQNILKKQANIDTTTDKIKKEIDEKDRNLKVADDKKNQIMKKIEVLKNKINEEKSKFEKRKRDANERQNEINHEIKMLQIYAQDLKNLQNDMMSEADREQRIRDCELKMEQIKQEIKRLNQEHRSLLNRLDDCIPEIQSSKSRLESLENVNEQKLKFLKTKFPDVYEAIKWLDENSHMFRGRVYKPIIMELSVTNPDHAKYLENTIPLRDLLAFSCENTSDLSLLTTELCNKKNLLVNISHAPPPEDDVFVPNIPIEEIRQYGFESYLIDLIQGPRAVLGYLCSLFQIQNIPYGSDHVKNFVDQIPHDIRNYFGGDSRYVLSISKYGNRESSLTKTSITHRGLLSSIDEKEIGTIKSRLNELIRISDKLRNQRNTIEAQIREKEISFQEAMQTTKEIHGKKSELKQKLAQLERQKQKIDALKKEVVVIPDIEREMKNTCAKAILDLMKLQILKVDALNEIEKAMEMKSYAGTKLTIFKQENEELTNNIASTKEKRDTAKNRVEVISNKCNNLKRDAKSKLTESLKLTNQIDPTDRRFPQKEFYSTLTNNLEELRDIISDFSGRLDCMDDVDAEFDFESYGIEILVQYRKNVPLQALNRHVQSGGERAVAIAVYTMSMQHITHVPFRCVDEINQGMDARNERKIFEMLVDETTKTGRAQYFFVTPKLLRNLKTNERMSVHVVFNGRMVQSQNAFATI